MTTREQAIAAYNNLNQQFKARGADGALYEYFENQVAEKQIAGDYTAIINLIKATEEAVANQRYQEQIWKDAGRKYYLETGSYPYDDEEYPMGLRAVARGRYMDTHLFDMISLTGLDAAINMDVGGYTEWNGEYMRIVFRRVA